MDDWWHDLDRDILAALAERRAMTPAEIAQRLGLPESAVVSLLAGLVSEGKVRICLVERAA